MIAPHSAAAREPRHTPLGNELRRDIELDRMTGRPRRNARQHHRQMMGEMPGGMMGPIYEPGHRTETVRRGGADEMQAPHRVS